MPCLGREEALVEQREDDEVDWKYYRMTGKEGRKFLNWLRAHEIPLKLGARYRPGQPVKLREHNIEELNKLCPFAEMAKKWRGVDKDVFNDFTGKITTSDKAPVDKKSCQNDQSRVQNYIIHSKITQHRIEFGFTCFI